MMEIYFEFSRVMIQFVLKFQGLEQVLVMLSALHIFEGLLLAVE